MFPAATRFDGLWHSSFHLLYSTFCFRPTLPLNPHPQSPATPKKQFPISNLGRFLGKLHMVTAKQLNQWDQQPGRKIWFQYWDSHITFEKSYLARLHYVHNNPVKHGLVANATNYPWCSASWFEQNSPQAFVKTVYSFKTDQLVIPDDF
jgi:putative transposase